MEARIHQRASIDEYRRRGKTFHGPSPISCSSVCFRLAVPVEALLPSRPRMATRWLTFDCFGTLVDWNAGFRAILQPVVGEQTGALLQAYHRLEPRVQAERPFRFYREVLATTLSLAGREIGLEFTKSETVSLAEQWGVLPLFADVESALTGLRALGYKTAVLTYCDDDLFAKTQRSFTETFDLVVTAERVRDYKPEPAHFRFFEQATGVSRLDWLHVASSWFHDIAPAGELGIRRIWIDGERIGANSDDGCLRLWSIKDLPAAVTRLRKMGGEELST